jgi:hypothetical protein
MRWAEWRVQLVGIALLGLVVAAPARAGRFMLSFGPFKPAIQLPGDPFEVRDASGLSWVKFTIRLSEPGVVHFQNGNQHRFHYDFVMEALDPYLGISRADFEALSFYAVDQELVLGTVLYRRKLTGLVSEVAIQLVRADAYSVAEIVHHFGVVRDSLLPIAGAAPPVIYLPTLEQQPSALQNAAALDAEGVQVKDAASWLGSDASPSYAGGWAHGRLVELTSAEIGPAYAAGTLTPNDVLLTDGVPAEIPFVAGVLSLAPATPNSHVAILSRDWRIPFAYLSEEQWVAEAQRLVGERVLVRVPSPDLEANGSPLPGLAIWPGSALNPSLEAELHALKRTPELPIVAKASYGALSESVELLSPADLRFFGGKASSYALLRDAIPQGSRFAVALSFDLWDQFMAQPIGRSLSLAQDIAQQLAPFDSYPPDFDSLGQGR